MINDHFDGQKYFYPGSKPTSFFAALTWMLTRKPKPWPKFFSIIPTKPALAIHDSLPFITFVNHSTVLIQWHSINILTDPIWSERASPFSWIGPKRVHPPGIRFSDLPPIDLIFLSHNHYDHLDLRTLQTISSQYQPLIITGLGNKNFLLKRGIARVKELDWWQELSFKNLNIAFTPAKHFSARWPWDRNKTLFGSFVISDGKTQVFFAGDTGYDSHFKEIRKRFGATHLAFLPIGAFEPRWLMEPNHLAPWEALQAHDDLQSAVSMAIHHSTFPLADESFERPKDLINALKGKRQFIVLNPGDTYRFP
ncbi:MAG: MBL fold metallo-hydrolase [Parachlamydiaceae bacterium]